MSNITTTSYDGRPLALGRIITRGETLALAAADTILKGTILARDTGTDKLVLFEKGGTTTGNGVVKCVLNAEVVIAAAGDVLVDVIDQGEVDQNLLVIDADQDASNVDGAVRDGLRAYGIVSRDVNSLGS